MITIKLEELNRRELSDAILLNHGDYIVVNIQVANALEINLLDFNVSPSHIEDLGEIKLSYLGNIANKFIYVDPLMSWDNTVMYIVNSLNEYKHVRYGV